MTTETCTLHLTDGGAVCMLCTTELEEGDERALLQEVPKFLAVYAHSYGFGRTPEQARRLARDNGGRGNAWVVYRLPAGAYRFQFDCFGGVSWAWMTKADQERDERMELFQHGRGYKPKA